MTRLCKTQTFLFLSFFYLIIHLTLSFSQYRGPIWYFANEEEKLPHGFILTTVCLYSFLLLDSAFTIKLRDGSNSSLIPSFFPRGWGRWRASPLQQVATAFLASPMPAVVSGNWWKKRRGPYKSDITLSYWYAQSGRKKRGKKIGSLETNFVNGNDKIGHIHFCSASPSSLCQSSCLMATTELL